MRAEFTSPAGQAAGYEILGASLAAAAGDGLDVKSDTVKTLTFSGRSDIDLPPGSRVLSDPVALPTTTGSIIDVTVTASPGQAPTSQNLVDVGGCTQTPIFGTAAATAPGQAFSVPHALMWLRSLLVYGSPRRSIAAFGDSITVSPQVPLHSYWTDVLLRQHVAIVNAGVGGSYLTQTGMFGTAVGLSRLGDLLTEPGLSDVVMLIGTNDLAIGVSPVRLLTALASALQDARDRHVRLWVCTILPREGSAWPASAEQARVLVNSVLRSPWLSQHGGLLVDTDKALRDPGQPGRLLAVYDSGDHLHPSAAGARELGITVGLAIGLLV